MAVRQNSDSEKSSSEIHKLYKNRGVRFSEPFVLWFTGLSGSGKSTLSEKMFRYLKEKEFLIEHLDGDAVREVFPATGFTKNERDMHIKRIGFVASLLEKNGVAVIASFISPYRESRDFVRSICRNFIEVHVAADIEECEKRDVKGLYKKARKGEIENFTGISAPYEEPLNPDIKIDTTSCSVEECFEEILCKIKKFM
ncbi:MAG: adenylyl-sulfate kinase [bacterium]